MPPAASAAAMSNGAAHPADESPPTSFVFVDQSAVAGNGEAAVKASTDGESDLQSMISDLGKLMSNPLDSGVDAPVGGAKSKDSSRDSDEAELHDLLAGEAQEEFKDAEETGPEPQGRGHEYIQGADETDFEVQDEATDADEAGAELPDERSQGVNETGLRLQQEEYLDEEETGPELQESASEDVEETGPELQDNETGPELQDNETGPELQESVSEDVEETGPELQDNETGPELQENVSQGVDETGPELQDDRQEDSPDAAETDSEQRPAGQVLEPRPEGPTDEFEESQAEVLEVAPVIAESKAELQEQLPTEIGIKPELQDVPNPQQGDTAAAEEYMDVLGNGQLLKKTLTPGLGQATRPKTDCRVTVNFEARLGSGDLAGDIVDRQEGLTLTIGDCELVQALDIALMLVELGERCQVVSGPQFAYGDKRPHTTHLGCVIPPGASLTFVVDLTRVEEPLDPGSQSLEERLALADAKRERGNFWFNREDYYTAVCCYARSATVLERHCSDDMSGADNSALQAALDARVRVYNNLAACQLKLEAWEAVIESSDKALRLQPSNAKAMYRKGRALSSRGDHSGALRVLRAALGEDPESRVLQNEVARVTLECRRQQTASQDLYRRMMGVKSPGGGAAQASASASASSSPASAASDASVAPAASAASSSILGRYKYWLAGAVGSLLVSAILAGAAYRNNR